MGEPRDGGEAAAVGGAAGAASARARVAGLRPGSGAGPRPPRAPRRAGSPRRDRDPDRDRGPAPRGARPPTPTRAAARSGRAWSRQPTRPCPGRRRPPRARTLTGEKRRATLSRSKPPGFYEVFHRAQRNFRRKLFARVPSAYTVPHGAAGTSKARQLSPAPPRRHFPMVPKERGAVAVPRLFRHLVVIIIACLFYPFFFFRGASPENPLLRKTSH